MIDYNKYQKDLEKIEAQYDYDPNKIYYFNVHRPTQLVQALQKRYELFDYSILPHLVQKALGKKLLNYTYNAGVGTGHLIFFLKVQELGDLVLRTNFLLKEPETYMAYEKEFAEMYENVGIPSSHILFSDTSRKEFPFDYQIMHVLPGKSLATEFTGTQKDYENIVFQQGQMAAREYKIPMKGKGWGRIIKNQDNELVGTFNTLLDYINAYLEHDLQILELFKFASKKDISKLYDFFNSAYIKDLFSDTKYGYLVHNDPSDHNLRYNKDQLVAIFDWENAAIYDPICEIGTAPTWSAHYPKRKKLIEGFVAELGYKPDNLEQKMAVYFLRKMIDKVQFALRGKRLAPKHINFFKEGVKDNQLNVKVLVSV